MRAQPLRGQLEAITQQLQRDEHEAQRLSQEEQALTQEWLTVLRQPQRIATTAG